ncbi:TspO/MBR family protein [Staphylococcus canis]|uniref:Tryptophan-rich sensory protein n=1 Tax=Staphylococcus canis TaxID=2724942 RepID=A0ABS0TAP4_9STAP|nr:TspO/MBR family protein [Staphylococcus canis]MBI5974839.1 tryptophan-rich sensory protein [Staphylococcus canis]
MSLRTKLTQTVRTLTPLIGGQLIGKFAVQNAREDYQKNVKPPLSPPGYVFPIVWTLLYTGMGVAYMLVRRQSQRRSIKIWHYSHLTLNYAWTILYFRLKLRFSALIESIALLGTVVATTVSFFKVHKLAGILLIPYALWCAFATYLTAGNWYLNKDNPKFSED